MCGTKLNRFLLLLVALFFLSSAFCWAEDETLTPEQWQTLKTELENLKTQLEIVKQQRDESKTAQAELTQQVETLMTQLIVQSDLLEALSKSLQTLNQENLINDLKYFGLGALTGFVVGNYTGINIGVSLRL